MAPQVGLEPTTDRLTADSSTTELLRNNEDNLYLIKILCKSRSFNNILFKRDMFIIYWIAFYCQDVFDIGLSFLYTFHRHIFLYLFDAFLHIEVNTPYIHTYKSFSFSSLIIRLQNVVHQLSLTTHENPCPRAYTLFLQYVSDNDKAHV